MMNRGNTMKNLQKIIPIAIILMLLAVVIPAMTVEAKLEVALEHGHAQGVPV